MTFDIRNNATAVRILAFTAGMLAACLIGFARPSFVTGNNDKRSSEQLAKQAPFVAPLSNNPVSASSKEQSTAVEVEPRTQPEGPLERFKRNLLVAVSSNQETDKQIVANQLDLFSIRATPRFREDVLVADKDFAQVEKLAISSPVLSRAAARFLGVCAADRVVTGNKNEAKRLLGLSERLQPGLDLQRTVRSALLRLGTAEREVSTRPNFEVSSTESFFERVLSFFLALIVLGIFVMACVFGFIFYRRTVGVNTSLSESGNDKSEDDTGYIGKIRKLVVVPGNRAKGGSDGSEPSPDDEPAVKLKRAA